MSRTAWDRRQQHIACSCRASAVTPAGTRAPEIRATRTLQPLTTVGMPSGIVCVHAVASPWYTFMTDPGGSVDTCLRVPHSHIGDDLQACALTKFFHVFNVRFQWITITLARLVMSVTNCHPDAHNAPCVCQCRHIGGIYHNLTQYILHVHHWMVSPATWWSVSVLRTQRDQSHTASVVYSKYLCREG